MPKLPYKLRQPCSLEDAVTETLSDLGGAKAAACLAGVRVAAHNLTRYSDQQDRTHVIPMDVAAVLCKEAVRRDLPPHLLLWLQDQVAAPANPIALPKLAARLGKEAAEVFTALAQATDPAGPGGGGLTPRERSELMRDLQDVIRVAQAGLMALEAGQ